MSRVKKIVTSEIEGRNLSDFYGDNSYSFDSTGQINYYGENKMGPVIEPGIVYGSNADSGDGYGYNTLKLVPHSPDGYINDDRYLVIDPTAPNHIHIRAGGIQDASNAELILGAEQANVKVLDSTHEVQINTYNSGSTVSHNWTFVNDGTIYGPSEGGALLVTGIQNGNGINNLPVYSSGGMTITANGGDMNFYMDGGMYIGPADSNNQIIKRSDLNTVDAKTLPTGGTTGQVLSKVDDTDFNATWVDAAAGSSSTSVIKHSVKLGESVTKGQAVYVSSADGTNMIVSKASNATEATSSKTLGLIETTGVLNDAVNVVAEGLLEGLDTSTATAGDPVWLGTSGNLIYGLANKPVAPDHLVFIGVVTRAQQNNGEIFVKVQNGFELDELHTVSLEATASIADNEVLAFDSATGLWKNQTATEAGLQTRVANVSDTEIGYLDGVTSAIQTQLDAKLSTATAGTTYAPKASPTFTGTVTLPSTINGTNASTNMFLFPTTSAANVTIADAITNGTLGFATGSAFNGTINVATGGITSGSKTINIGTGQGVGGGTYITMGSTNGTSSISLLGSVYANSIAGTTNTSGVNLFNSTTSGNITIGSALTSSSVALANGTNFAGSINIASGATVSGSKTINIGVNGQGGSTTSINIGSATGATSNTYLNGKVIMQNPTVPGSATATGTAGEIAWDANYVYVCTATNTWKRTALSTW